MGYISGFDDKNKALRQKLEKQWREKRDRLFLKGILNQGFDFETGVMLFVNWTMTLIEKKNKNCDW